MQKCKYLISRTLAYFTRFNNVTHTHTYAHTYVHAHAHARMYMIFVQSFLVYEIRAVFFPG